MTTTTVNLNGVGVLAESKGITGDGDETAKIQLALNGLRNYETLLFKPGPTFKYTVLTLPSVIPATHGAPGISTIGSGQATLMKIGGSPDFGIAPDRWVTGAQFGTFGGTPWTLSNLYLDFGSLANCLYGVVSKNYDLSIRLCTIVNADTGVLITRQNENGSLGTTDFLGDQRIEENRIYNCRRGFYCQGQADNLSQASTDGHFIRNAIGGGTVGEIGMEFDTTGGWHIETNAVYGQSVSPAKFNNMSRGGKITGNNLDASGHASSRIILGATAQFQGNLAVFSKNHLYCPVRCDFRADTVIERIVLSGNAFWLDTVNSQDAFIEHNNNNANKILISRMNDFVTTNPHRFGAGVTLGTYRVEGGSDGNGLLPFTMKPPTSSTGLPTGSMWNNAGAFAIA